MRWLTPVLALSPLLPALAGAEEFTGKVIGVSDGDTITVLRDKRPVKIRLHGVDCPEKNQPFGKKAKQFTSKLVFGKYVDVEVVTKDRYGRTVGKVRYPARVHRAPRDRSMPHRIVTMLLSLQEELVKAGLAWWYRKYAPDDKQLAVLEREAREANWGLWAGKSPVAPWDWRRGKRAGGHGPGCYEKCLQRRRSATGGGQFETPESECHRKCVTKKPIRGLGLRGDHVPKSLRCNIRSKVCHAPSCKDLARCKHCAARFSSMEQAKNAGYRPHKACVGCSTRLSFSLASQVDRRVRLEGRAAEGKAGSVVIPDATNTPVYVKGLHGWGDLAGKQVVVTGLLRLVKMIPDPVRDKSGAISQGAVGEQYVVEDAQWRRR